MKKAFFSLTLMLCSLMAWAQMVEPVKWSHKATVKGQELVVTFTATIDNGYHLYSMEIPEGGPQKT